MQYFICPCWSRVSARLIPKDNSSYMKKTLRAAGAAGLAAATIVTGLGFGPAASANDHAPAKSGSLYVKGRFVSKSTAWEFFAAGTPSAGAAVPSTLHSKLADAETNATEWTFPAVGHEGPIQAVGTNLCLNVSGSKGNPATTEPCDDRDSEQFRMTRITSSYAGTGYTIEPVVTPGPGKRWSFGNQSNGGWWFSSDPAGATHQGDDILPSYESFEDAVGAKVDDIDLEQGTAVVSGDAPGASQVKIEWTDQNDVLKMALKTVVDGQYMFQLYGLKIGTTPVKVTALDGSEEIASTTVDAKLEVAPIRAGAVFAENVETEVQLEGTAQPNTDVTVWHGENPLFTKRTNEEGHWRQALNPPNERGIYELAVTQKIRGENVGRIPLEVDYGDGVTITKPTGSPTLAPGEQLVIEGKAPKGTEVKVFEEGGPELGSARAGTSSYILALDGLEDREYELVVQGKTKGNNVTQVELTVNPGKSAVAKPTAEVEFDADITKKATVKGTGVDGATITIKDEAGSPLGSTTVAKGTWSKQINPVGAGEHTLKIEQSGIDGVQETTTVADFGAAVTITEPTDDVTPGYTEVTGTTQPGAKVAVSVGDQTVDAEVDGTTWTAEVEIAPATDPVTITATQQSKGALRTEASQQVTTDGAQVAVPVAITSPEDGYYAAPPASTRVAGTATPYATVTLRSEWGTIGTATADAKGDWQIWGSYGPSAAYKLTASQTRLDNSTSESAVFTLAPKGSTEHKEVVITTPSGTYDPDANPTLVRGTASPFARVSIAASWGELDSVYADQNGDWAYYGFFGPSATYELTATQTRADGTTSTSNVIRLRPKANQSSPVVITTPDGTYAADGVTEVSGTASPNATIRLSAAWGDLEPEVTADSDGNWTYYGHFGPSATYNLTATQTRTGGSTSTSNTIVLTPEVDPLAPVVITTPSGTYEPGGWTTIRGTSAPGAEVTIKAQWGPLGSPVKADGKGNWVYNDSFGPSATYQLTATQQRADGGLSDSNTITLTPADN